MPHLSGKCIILAKREKCSLTHILTYENLSFENKPFVCIVLSLVEPMKMGAKIIIICNM